MVRLNRIYTRTGDDGTTGLVDGSRLAKSHPRMEAIGAVDEVNSLLGVALLHIEGPGEREMVARVQNELFDLGADIATPGDDFTPNEMTLRITAPQVARLEQEIDRLNEALAPLRSFTLPGGHPAAAHIHVARATARRAERAMVATQAEAPLNPQAMAYINRLSDHLFVLARHINAAGAGDPLWHPGATR